MTAEEPRGLVAEVAHIYRESRKNKDIAWNVYVARPLGAIALYFLRRTPITPNQLTFLGLFVFFGVPALLLTVPGPLGFLLGALCIEAAYILDCTDGQLARLKGMTSDVGAHLDFFIDELKALLLVAGCALRLWRFEGGETWLLVGVGGVLLVALSTSLTTFVRRPEYAGEEIRPGANVTGPERPQGLIPLVVWMLMRTLRLVVHYPSWVLFVAIAGVIAGVDACLWFLAPFLATYLLYAGKTSLGIFIKLAHPRFYK